MATPEVSVPNLATNAHGPALIGTFIALTLYGVCVLQTVNYYQKFLKDPKWMKVFIAVLMFGDTLNIAFIMGWMYEALILNFNDPMSLLGLPWMMGTEPATTGIIALMVQCFFSWRIYVLTKNLFLPLFIVAVSLTGCGAGIGFTVLFATYTNLVEASHTRSARISAPLWLGSSALADILITIAMTYKLNKSKTGFKKTETVLNRLITLTVQNGLLTTTVALVNMCLFLILPDSGLHFGFNIPITKLYTNSVLSILMARDSSRHNNNHGEHSMNVSAGTGVFVSVDIENMRVPMEHVELTNVDRKTNTNWSRAGSQSGSPSRQSMCTAKSAV